MLGFGIYWGYSILGKMEKEREPIPVESGIIRGYVKMTPEGFCHLLRAFKPLCLELCEGFTKGGDSKGAEPRKGEGPPPFPKIEGKLTEEGYCTNLFLPSSPRLSPKTAGSSVTTTCGAAAKRCGCVAWLRWLKWRLRWPRFSG